MARLECAQLCPARSSAVCLHIQIGFIIIIQICYIMTQSHFVHLKFDYEFD